MFVTAGAREKLIKKRKDELFEEYVVKMMQEAERLGITTEELTNMIKRGEQTR